MKDVNAALRGHLEHALVSERLGHALLFSGPKGSGKKALALWLAQRLLCASAGPPCGECPACTRIARGSHPDVTWIRPEVDDPAATAARKAQNKTPRQIISVDQVRAMESQAALAPFEGRARVFVLESAERMEAEGMNALLKLVEEPPPRTYVLLLAARREALLPTILSRVQGFRFRSLPEEELAARAAERFGWKPDEARWAAPLFGAEVMDGEAPDLEGLREERRKMLDALEGLGAPDAPLRIVETAEWMSRSGSSSEAHRHREALRLRLDMLGALLRDAVLLRAAPDPGPLMLHRDAASRLQPLAARLSAGACPALPALLEEASRALERNVERKLLVERLFFALRREMSA